MLSLVDFLGELLDSAASTGAWRPLLGLLGSAPVAFMVYVTVPEAPLRTWLGGSVLGFGLVAGLVWEWKSRPPGGE